MKSSKTILVALTLCLGLLPFRSEAQFILSKEKVQFSGIRFHIGGNADNYSNLNANGLFSMLKPNQGSDFDMSQYRAIDNGLPAENTGGALGFDLVFNTRSKDGFLRLNRELRIGLDLNIQREIMLDTEALDATSIFNPTLCLIENNLNLNVAYLFKTGRNGIVEAYAGPGANVGGSFGNDLIFLGTNDTTPYEAYGSTFVRAYALAGVKVNLWRVNVALEGNYGLGSQVVHNGDVNLLRTYGLRIAAGFRFN